MTDFSNRKTKKSSKEKSCDGCGIKINNGDQYVNIRGVRDGNWFALYNCMQCDERVQQMIKDKVPDVSAERVPEQWSDVYG